MRHGLGNGATYDTLFGDDIGFAQELEKDGAADFLNEHLIAMRTFAARVRRHVAST